MVEAHFVSSRVTSEGGKVLRGDLIVIGSCLARILPLKAKQVARSIVSYMKSLSHIACSSIANTPIFHDRISIHQQEV